MCQYCRDNHLGFHEIFTHFFDKKSLMLFYYVPLYQEGMKSAFIYCDAPFQRQQEKKTTLTPYHDIMKSNIPDDI